MDDHFTQDGNALVWTSFGETLRIESWGRDSLRIRAVMMGEITDTDYALLPPKPAQPIIEIGEGAAFIQNGNIRAEISTIRWGGVARLCFTNQHGEVLLREIDRGGCLGLAARSWKPIIGGDHSLSVAFDANPDEKLYGMGQYQQDFLNIKGCAFELAHRNSQASIPFILSSRGYGFFWHNPAIGRANFAKNRTEWQAESTKQMDYWITAGDTPRDIVAAYMEATGKPPMMPEYGLGFWQCKLRYWNQEQLLEVAREYKRRGLPIDVIVCDFFHWPKMGDFRFEEEFFPDPEAMTKELESMGIKLMVSVWPQIDLKSENFAEMNHKNLLVKTERGVDIQMRFGGESVFFDATNPKAQDYVWQKCKKNYYDKGVRLFWLDEAEPEYDVYHFDNYRYHMGPNVQVGNMYPKLFAELFYKGLRAEGQTEVVSLVRSAWAGSQRFGTLVWSGDVHSSYEDFRRQLVAGLQMGIAGIPWWTTDIGGFNGGDPKDPVFRELLVRWFQYATFCPVMRLHGNRAAERPEDYKVRRKDGSLALGTGGNNEIWSYGEEMYPVLAKYMHLREKLRPLTRELMHIAHEDGSPVMRTLFYEFPDDEACWEIKDEYLFGADILVAPVLSEGALSREVYLPEGNSWVYAWNDSFYKGGTTITVDTPIDTIPVFLREGRHKKYFV